MLEGIGWAARASSFFYTVPHNNKEELAVAADPIVDYLSKPAVQKAIEKTEKDMYKAAKEMDYMEAARLRDELEMLKNKLAALEA